MTSTAAYRLRSLLSGVASNQRMILVRFASTSSSQKLETVQAAVCPRNRTANVFEDQSDGSGSAAYIHAVKYSRPATIKLCAQRSHLQNSVSLIGTVERIPTEFNRRQIDGDFGVYTILNVKTSPNSNSSFRILVGLWNEIAKVALEHVKPGDHIYVSGSLESYLKPDSSGNYTLNYKVIAKELNFVKQDEKQKSHEAQPSKSQGGSNPKSKEDRLHLWQIFFSNANEWYDSRKNKKNPKYPDFKHKSTGEALWMSAYDPPWIKKQLELHDTMVAAGCLEDPSSHRRHVSSFVSDDLV